MKKQHLISTVIFLAVSLFSSTANAQELVIRPNNTVDSLLMIEPLNTNFGVFLGQSAGRLNMGFGNVFIGSSSGLVNSSGTQNTFIGTNAGASNTMANFNTVLGSFAGPVLQTGEANTFIGQAAGNKMTSGGNNTFIGRNSGANNIIGSGNVFLGSNAGFSETSSNKLYIHNSGGSSTDALIYGDFASKFLKINGFAGINRAFSGTTFNMRANPNDFLVLSTEDKDGEDLFTVQSAGQVFIKDSLGIGTFSPEANLHIKNGNKPRILVQSDGNDEESGRVSLRQSNGSGADVLYDGTNSQEVFAVETFSAGNSKGKKLTVGLDGNVGINQFFGDVGLNVRSVPNDAFIFNAEDGAGTDRFSVSPAGHVGINKIATGVGLNVRSVPNDVFILNAEDDAGTNRLMVSPDGHVGINDIFTNVGLNVRSVPNDLYIFNTQDDAGQDRFSVSPDGRVGINTITTGVALNVRSVPNDAFILNAEDDAGADRFTVKQSGEIGIGTVTPEALLHIRSNDYASLILEADADNGNELDNPILEFRQDGGATKAKIGYDEAEYGSNVFAIADVASNKYVLIKEDGDVGINVVPELLGSGGEGNYNFVSGSKLSVRGVISAVDFNQIDIEDWPDYVFEDGYNLMPLDELEKSIEKNNHLPGIPSAAEMEENGLLLGDMQVKMMEKIEELTLYIIALNKEIKVLKRNQEGGATMPQALMRQRSKE